MKLTSLAELRESVMDDSLALGIKKVRRKAFLMREMVLSLYEWIPDGGINRSQLKHGLDGSVITAIGGAITIIHDEAGRADMGSFPLLVGCHKSATWQRVESLEEFLQKASDTLNEIEPILAEQTKRANPHTD